MPIFEWEREYHFCSHGARKRSRPTRDKYPFPEGCGKAAKSLIETALRETLEEVGIEKSRIEPLGRFHDYISIHGYRVTPFAGFIDGPFTTVPQVREVAEVLQVPFRILGILTGYG